jgi:4-aminobutyrate aminotransferase / (S)-3-amino-2-methylpropionate transaminase / 5-aminovalerate transaminase
VDRARQIEERLVGRLHELQASDPRIGDVRGRGAMIAAEFVDPVTGKPDGALAKAVAAHAHANGVIALTCGTWGNIIRFLPPLSISDELLDEALTIVAEGLASAR